MSQKHPVQVRYRFEKAPAQSEFHRLAEVAHQIVRSIPWAVPHLPFGTTSRVSGGLLEALPSSLSPVQAGAEPRQELRLKAIELPDGTLLEHSYDAAGRLVGTLYPDNVRVTYLWNDADQLATVNLGKAQSITYRYDANGLLNSVTFSDGSRFSYEYDDNRNLSRLVFPDYKTIKYRYSRQGKPDEVAYDNSRLTYDWDTGGAIKQLLFQSAGQIHELPLVSDRLKVDLLVDRVSSDSGTRLVSPLGLWTYSSDGRLADMFLPHGDRLYLRRGADKQDMILWSSQGQTGYQSDKSGVLASVLYINGTRSVFRRVPGTRDVYRVNAANVSLFQYDDNGRLVKFRDDNGRYAVFSYERSGAATGVRTASGWMKVFYDNNSRLCEIRLSGGAACRLSYGGDGCPVSVSLRKMAPDALAVVLTFANCLWQWTSLKTSLRLEDTVTEGV